MTQAELVIDNGSSPYALPFDVMNANSVLVAATYIDTGGANLANLRFNDLAPTGYSQASRGGIAYWVNPSTAAGLAITGQNADTIAAVYELANVDLTAGVTFSGGSSITTSVDNEFVIGVAYENRNGLNIIRGASSVLTDRFIKESLGGSGGTLSAADATIANPGSHNVDWSGSNNHMAAAFEPGEIIPEPASLAMLGLGGLLIAGRRRRR